MIANLSRSQTEYIKFIMRDCRAIAKEIGARIRRTHSRVNLTLKNGEKHTFYGFIQMHDFLIKMREAANKQRD